VLADLKSVLEDLAARPNPCLKKVASTDGRCILHTVTFYKAQLVVFMAGHDTNGFTGMYVYVSLMACMYLHT